MIPVSRRFRLTAPNLRAGLRYDDIKIEQNPDVVKALERIPADELVNRCVAAARASFSESVFSPISRSASLSSNRRLKRAFDIDLKGSWLSPEMQAMQTPFEVRLARPARGLSFRFSSDLRPSTAVPDARGGRGQAVAPGARAAQRPLPLALRLMHPPGGVAFDACSRARSPARAVQKRDESAFTAP